jgi:phosphoribosyl-ATP pyrophosphohydrolase
MARKPVEKVVKVPFEELKRKPTAATKESNAQNCEEVSQVGFRNVAFYEPQDIVFEDVLMMLQEEARKIEKDTGKRPKADAPALGRELLEFYVKTKFPTHFGEKGITPATSAKFTADYVKELEATRPYVAEMLKGRIETRRSKFGKK